MNAHSRHLVLIAAVVALVQIGVLASMIVSRAAILRDGQEIVLEVQPVDPRDLLRGDYVRLGYNISSVPGELFEDAGSEPGKAGSYTVFVRLRAGGDGIWRPVAARFGAPPSVTSGTGTVDIRGASLVGDPEGAKSIAVDYGIERFYLPEGEGGAVEENLRERNFRMVVAVANDGAAQIKAFYDGDTLIYREPLY